MKTTDYIPSISRILLLALWIPVSLDKILHFEIFKSGILRQPFANWLGYALVYTLPIFELLIVLSLIFERFRTTGFMVSTALMTAFTGYIGIGLLGAWEKRPCGCGSVIAGMTWTQHFWFNLFFLGISLLGWLMHRKQDRKDVGFYVSTQKIK